VLWGALILAVFLALFNYPTPSGTFTGDRGDAQRDRPSGRDSGQAEQTGESRGRPISDRLGEDEMQYIFRLINDLLEKPTNLSTASKYTAVNGVGSSTYGRSATHCLGGLDADAFHRSRFLSGTSKGSSVSWD
jgi:hypothetical protein